MERAQLEPAASVIKALSGVDEVSRICRVHRTRVYAWMRSKDDGGTGGTIPQKHHPILLRAAQERGVALRAEHFLPETVQ